jgi:organic hydroperoxide reductase OsmC/OhrA
MPSDRSHHYRIATRWTGNLGTGTSTYRAYSRSHEIGAASKLSLIPGSSDPMFRGDSRRYNPEELLLGALASCHMLWVLHLCADTGIVVVDYFDEAEGEMVEHTDGSAEFTRVVLHPHMIITDGSRIADAAALHDRAHAVCAIARSVKFAVHHEPVVTAVA